MKTRTAIATLLCASALAHPAHAQADSKAAFFARLGALCGVTFEGASVFPREAGDAFAGKKLVANVAKCGATEIRVPFIVGEDRSRTWIITKAGNGLELKHDHRHADGTPDEQTMYGGMASEAGSSNAQSFHADAYTAKLIPAAATNVWTLTLSPDGKTLTYFLERDGKPRFKAELLRK
ncbi:MAG TPA: hypothetical protein VFT37_14925 [Telluria sp.]|nr:hypothetical protein [Telluria sp.]